MDKEKICEDEAKRLIRKHLGVSLYPCQDAFGNITIGVGRNLTSRGLFINEINYLFDNDYEIFTQMASGLIKNYYNLPFSCRMGLLLMAFSIGSPAFSHFTKMHQALDNSDLGLAADEVLASKWAKQAGSQATEIADLIRSRP